MIEQVGAMNSNLTEFHFRPVDCRIHNRRWNQEVSAWELQDWVCQILQRPLLLARFGKFWDVTPQEMC